MNYRGGTLYIGVNDAGQPVGLHPDFSTFKDKNVEDAFRVFKLSDIDALLLNTTLLEKKIGLLKPRRRRR